MRTKKLNIEFEEAKVVNVDIDLHDLENYKDKFLALKNHERGTNEILDVRGFYGSNEVRVVFLIEENQPEAEEVKACKEFAEQFGKITRCEVGTAWLLNDTYMDGVTYELNKGTLNPKDWFVYGKQC